MSSAFATLVLAGACSAAAPEPAAQPAPTPPNTAARTPRAPDASRPPTGGGTARRDLLARPTGDSAAMYERIEDEILAELNRARTNPRSYAATLDTLAGWYDGRLFRRPGALVLETNEGAAAAREAALAVRSQPPVPRLEWSAGLTRAARDHVRDRGPGGGMGHKGSDGALVMQRANRYGRWNRTISENIAYGPLDARGMVAGLIIDDGVPNRGHRVNTFDPNVRLAGIACGPHRVYGRMCVIVHAGEYTEAAAAR
jgi:uncharacterized protein YkwD